VKKVLVIAPHPDDETLGCGGTLLKHIYEGDEVCWLIMTSISESLGFSSERIQSRASEIRAVADTYNFKKIHCLELPTTQLDTLPKSDLVKAIGTVIGDISPNILYIPYRNDVHSDHAAVFDASISCSKTFRYPSIRQICAYETLSETEFGLRPDDPGFRPNLFVDISLWITKKVDIMRMYSGEMGPFPFPRSEECIRAQAMMRGSQAGVQAAEAFMILKELR
jgi:LmbE family N-acetylglucosaminyl deacetylase